MTERNRSWAGDQYAKESGHHRSWDDWFLDQHPPRSADRIIDVGCGSGEFTARLAGLASQGQVLGVDPDPSMLEAATQHHAANLEFRQGRAQDLDQVCGASWADLVVSRAVFHWIPATEHLASFEAVWRTLQPGGWFHAEFGGAGNVERLGLVLDDIAEGLGLAAASVSFPHAGTILEVVEQAGFEVPAAGVTTVAQRRPFDREKLLGFIRTQAAVAHGLGDDEELLSRFLSEATRRLGDFRRHDGSYDQTFVRVHVLARRPG